MNAPTEAPASQVLAPGTVLSDRYRVDALLGEGGMGVVYLAEHVHIRKRVALKVLLPEWTSTPEVVARFEQEAVAAGAISHPNVAAATDFGRLPDGSFFLILEYLEGRTLRHLLADGALSPERALAIARGVALGIGAAHAKGIVHRDLKPENVMLVTRDGDPDFVKVLDFGIARVETQKGGRGALTSAGAILGTPHYMAPEQALGRAIDARADLYALGVMLYEMLTGDCPFRGEAITLLRQHVVDPVPPLPPAVAQRVAPEAQTLVARLLEKEPAARYQDAGQVVAALDACLAGAAPPSRIVVVPRPELPAASPWPERARKVRAWSQEARARTQPTLAWLRARAEEARAYAVAEWRRRPRVVLATAGGTAALLLAALTTIALVGRRAPEPAALVPTSATPADPPPPAVTDDLAAPAKDAVLSCLEGRFGDRIEEGRPAGDAREIAAARKVIYWVDLENNGRPTRVTLVWTIDGKEVQRQTLGVGHAPHWRTWGVHKVGGAHEIAVQVLDASGRPLKEDSVTLDG